MVKYEGEVTAPAEGESINLYGKVAILVSGQATASAGADLFLHRSVGYGRGIFFS